MTAKNKQRLKVDAFICTMLRSTSRCLCPQIFLSKFNLIDRLLSFLFLLTSLLHFFVKQLDIQIICLILFLISNGEEEKFYFEIAQKQCDSITPYWIIHDTFKWFFISIALALLILSPIKICKRNTLAQRKKASSDNKKNISLPSLCFNLGPKEKRRY